VTFCNEADSPPKPVCGYLSGMRARFLALLLVAAAAGGLLFAYRAPANQVSGPAAPPPVPVATGTVAVGAVPVQVAANGTVQPVATVAVRARVDGQIEEVAVREGTDVKAGDLLFRLDTSLIRTTMQQLEANLERDRAQLAQAQADAARYASLVRTGAGARQQADQTRSQALALAATVKADEAQIAQTQVTLSYSEIRAEIDGRLGAIPLKAGNYVRAADGTVLTTITRIDPIQVQFAVPERYLPDLRAAQQAGTARVRVRIADSHEPEIEGRLVFLDSQVDATTGTITLKGEFANGDRRLWPGQYVNVTLILRDDPGTITVPVAAVQLGQTGNQVFVIGPDGAARRRKVTLVRILGDRAVVTGDLQAGQKVVTDGVQLLADGTRTVDRTAPQARP